MAIRGGGVFSGFVAAVNRDSLVIRYSGVRTIAGIFYLKNVAGKLGNSNPFVITWIRCSTVRFSGFRLYKL